MPFNPTLPVNGSLISSGKLRAQLVALHGDIQTRVTQAALNDALLGTSANTNNVGTLGMSISDPPQQWEVQTIQNKLDELINVLRR